MLTENRPAKSKKMETKAWVDCLAATIDNLGARDFPSSLVAALKTITVFDNSVVFAYYKNEKPVCLYHTFPPRQQIIFVDDYLKGPYLLDPFFKACERKVDVGLYRLADIAPDRFLQSEYYRSYYIQTGLSEEICYTFYIRDDVTIVISLMRSGENAKFSARDFRQLDAVTPIIASLARKHWLKIPDRFGAEKIPGERIDERTVIDRTVSALFAKRITPRETQVVTQVLEGHSSDSIAKNLGIAVGTVRIHRRNIYAKLQISSQQELFSIFIREMTKEHD